LKGSELQKFRATRPAADATVTRHLPDLKERQHIILVEFSISVRFLRDHRAA
jgi:hypothetical protein